jgi:hypothetical protein
MLKYASFLCLLLSSSGHSGKYDLLKVEPPSSRYELCAPLPGLPATMLDTFGANSGVAQQMAQSRSLQGRIFWIDATANLERLGSEQKIAELVQKIKQVGFNTIVYDVKPIVGYTVYPSKLTKKITEWKGQRLPEDFDPLRYMVREAKKNEIPLLVSLNAFSEGHALFQQGPGYEMADLQTVLYDSVPVLRTGWPEEQSFPLCEKPDQPLSEEQKIYVYRSLESLPKESHNLWRVVLSAQGVVRQVIENGKVLEALPKDHVVLLGRGPGEDFLRSYTWLSRKLFIVSQPVFVKINERPRVQYPLMMNPHLPAVQERALAFIKEVLENYEVDGIVYDDRLRFAGDNADFSEYTRAQFEKYVGKKLEWPKDVFEYSYTPSLERGVRPGKYWEAWWVWRALAMRNWIARVRNLVDSLRPDALFGIYAGSWYGEYNKYGSNYGSDELVAGFNFLTDAYRRTGFAELLDFVITGCYYSVPTLCAALENNKPLGSTVEAAAQLSNSVVRDQAWTYAGIMLADYFHAPSLLEQALQAACWHTQGVMIFDLSHKIELFWDILERAFKNDPRRPPHLYSKLLGEVRKTRKLRDQKGFRGPAVIFYEGAAGAGF